MSEVYHGTIFPAGVDQAKSEFAKLSSDVTLRLISFSEGIQAVYSVRNNRALAALSAVSQQLSTVFEFAFLYFYDSCTGFDCALFERGRQSKATHHRHGYHAFDTRNKIPDFEDAFEFLERLGLNDDHIEGAFHWNNRDAVLHNQPAWELAKYRNPLGSLVTGRVAEHYKHSGIVITLGDAVARGFVVYTAFGDTPHIATANFPDIGTELDCTVVRYGDEWDKTLFLQPVHLQS